MSKKILIITTSGGSGHLQAAEAIKQDILEKDPNTEIFLKELFLDFGFKYFGRLGIYVFNKSQKKGSVFCREFLVKMLFIADIVFYPKILITFFNFLYKHDFDEIIDTQPVGNSSLIQAIKIYNKIKKRNLFLQKVIIDMPTKRSKHFFKSIKKLSDNNKKLIQIISFDPLLEDEKNETDFWQNNTGMPLESVKYTKYFVRKSFEKIKNENVKKDAFQIEINFNNFTDISKKILDLSSSKYLKFNDKAYFIINKNDKLITILLGSQPAISATVNYVKEMIEIMKNIDFLSDHYLFVYLENEKIMFEHIVKLIQDESSFPKNLKIIPMSFQTEETIARLFFRSDITITKSGGATTIELLTVANGKTLIHSDEENKDPLKGIPYWEAGNALYLKNKRKAEFVNPKTLKNLIFHSLESQGCE